MAGPEGTRVDLHVKVLDEAVVARAKARGLDGLVYAPHFKRLPAIRRRAAEFSDDDLFVIPAREIFTGNWRNRKHILALDLDAPIPDFISLSGAMEELKRQDAVVLVPHPGFLTVSLDEQDIHEHRSRIHAIETYNLKNWPHHTRRATRYQTRIALPEYASSYAHLRGSVGHAWTVFPDTPASKPAVLRAIREGAARSIQCREGLDRRLQSSVEFMHLFWENSVQKAVQFMQGVKATNPHHPAYPDRYRDIAAYDAPRIRSFQPSV